MNTAINPKPCPFCGLSTALTLDRIDAARAITCDNCGAAGALVFPAPTATVAEITEMAAAAWNKRDPLGPRPLTQNIREVAAAALVALPLYAIAAVLIGGI